MEYAIDSHDNLSGDWRRDGWRRTRRDGGMGGMGGWEGWGDGGWRGEFAWGGNKLIR